MSALRVPYTILRENNQSFEGSQQGKSSCPVDGGVVELILEQTESGNRLLIRSHCQLLLLAYELTRKSDSPGGIETKDSFVNEIFIHVNKTHVKQININENYVTEKRINEK